MQRARRALNQLLCQRPVRRVVVEEPAAPSKEPKVRCANHAASCESARSATCAQGESQASRRHGVPAPGAGSDCDLKVTIRSAATPGAEG